jgi:transaldolase
MQAPQLLHDPGQTLWLDNITRDLLDNGTLQHYIAELLVTGLTSNPIIFYTPLHKTFVQEILKKERAHGKHAY